MSPITIICSLERAMRVLMSTRRGLSNSDNMMALGVGAVTFTADVGGLVFIRVEHPKLTEAFYKEVAASADIGPKMQSDEKAILLTYADHPTTAIPMGLTLCSLLREEYRHDWREELLRIADKAKQDLTTPESIDKLVASTAEQI